ncbi:zinc-binding dehydrogenase [Streptomyces millisiae]|uniref:Zinc-binding dehydrogenase n=1 Tax=Streptomyces millisiae TaxID=3075542 RepID=A0ABU2LN72_9ACTN|nr:zinc-binding dehydrogenase [Streptomyces sp. DSM 44918]MDT0319041.1 zinc-binding dehydrogenase [Streptomyces sp. DSM 44918]
MKDPLVRALVVDHTAPGHLSLTDVPVPRPTAHETLVRVEAVSLNSGEVYQAIRPETPNGTQLGWDAAGVVIQQAADGSGPAEGTRVVTVGQAGWAELRATPANLLGTAPENADPGALSTIPVAGLSALRVLRRMGSLLGRRVMVTGASGGVGRYAVQLAARAGAHVVAISRSPAQADGLRNLGAQEVHSEPAAVRQPVSAVVDNVGGQYLVDAFASLSAGGTLFCVGRSSEADVMLSTDTLLGAEGPYGRSIHSFFLTGDPTTDFSADLTWLAGEIATGRLHPSISWRGPWTRHAEAVQLLLDGRLHGKAVLDLG